MRPTDARAYEAREPRSLSRRHLISSRQVSVLGGRRGRVWQFGILLSPGRDGADGITTCDVPFMEYGLLASSIHG